ncbi:hypothetical protein AO268_17120 [Pseudomonas sp. ICMP 8385]|uniref:Uncharacterized protein n=2 Tax=Pseudomonas gessardii TaxID=78544 RepID=A0ABS9EZ34_9PSED|nr:MULTISPECIES: hypothetical protein [Pseudomonas]MCF4977084.1 hypothetical protein [Pseudomonas gessardii]MCF4990442.1 hypothetical protein [Pseudomonas gessardii]MCF5085317.1 hypothetical protein [Pseudomonas gessardii]MCF5105458.1 hypothetical protein [Pseudomonas gessardii]PHN59795.1 hypothetical protein AO268_17120 [Pseudomonas sp. ICMP 8385]
MKKLVAALIVANIALGSTAVMATGGNPYNNGHYELMNKDTTPMLVWRNGKLVKNPEYAIERSNAQESRQNVPPTSDGSKQDE